MDNELLAFLAEDYTSSTPGEVVHLPEGVQWKHEREHRNGKDVEHHPTNHVPLAAHDEDESL